MPPNGCQANLVRPRLNKILKVYATNRAEENVWIVRWLDRDICFSFVDRKNRLIPFRLMPVKLASLVQHGTIQGSVNECSDTAMECGTVWQDSKRASPERRGPILHLLSLWLRWK